MTINYNQDFTRFEDRVCFYEFENTDNYLGEKGYS